jgi:SNF2 family DNA or RNA helicase
MAAVVTLYPFQESGVTFFAERRVGFLLDDMGLGKSAQAITAADRVKARSILVICPAIARETWSREWTRWQATPRSIQVVRTGIDARKRYSDVVIVSYALADKIHARFDLVILDEAQNVKSPGTVRTRAIYGRDGIITRTQRVWLLSGTLAPNHPGELWTHYKALLRGDLSYWPFVERYCTTKETKFGIQITGANRARLPELAKFLRPHVLQRRQRDVLSDLPPLRWGHIPVAPEDVPPRPESTPEELAVLGKLDRGEDITSTDAMHLMTLRRWTGIAKASAVVELVKEELESISKIVVFALHREVIKSITGSLGPLVEAIHGGTSQKQRQNLIDAFQNTDRPRVLVLQINTAGTALTLHAASRVIFAETTWTPGDVVQAAKRCHRIGQAHSVLASIISLAGSIDERVAAVITRKAQELVELENLITEKVA